MLRFFFLLLLLAAFGLYSLMGAFLDSASPSGQASTEGASSPGLLATMATKAVSDWTGLQIQPMPHEGCGEGSLSPDKLAELSAALPDEQRAAFESLLGAAPDMPVQMYNGPAGMGLCIPKLGRMALLPTHIFQNLNLDVLRN